MNMSGIERATPAYGAGQFTASNSSSSSDVGRQSSDTAVRENDLARQLDSRLTEQISRIRGQIAPAAQAGGSGLGSVLDILA